MKKRNNATTIFIITFILITFGMLMPLWSHAGSLEPSSAPDSTMKTLDEVEPRTAIPASSTAVGTYTISESGSYYLAGDRLCVGTGIIVSADNVTLDLMGYSLIGPGSGTNYGVFMNGKQNVEIKNGTIRSFQSGIYEAATAGSGHRVIDVRSVSNTGYGIFIGGSSSLIKGCTISDNGASSSTVYGIYAGEGSTVTDNLLFNNGTSSAATSIYIIGTDEGCIVSNNTIRDNGNNSTGGGYFYGIYAGTGSKVINNTSTRNGDSSSNHVYGIMTGNGSVITGNTSTYNGDSSGQDVYGIYSGNGSTVTNNNACYNGLSGTGTATGIYPVGNSLISQNTAFNNADANFGACASCNFVNNYPVTP